MIVNLRDSFSAFLAQKDLVPTVHEAVAPARAHCSRYHSIGSAVILCSEKTENIQLADQVRFSSVATTFIETERHLKLKKEHFLCTRAT